MSWGAAASALGRAADLAKLPANTWVELNYATVQPNDDADEKGQLSPAGRNKLVYDPDGKRVLFYDRWADKKHGGYTIYGNWMKLCYDPHNDCLIGMIREKFYAFRYVPAK